MFIVYVLPAIQEQKRQEFLETTRLDNAALLARIRSLKGPAMVYDRERERCNERERRNDAVYEHQRAVAAGEKRVIPARDEYRAAQPRKPAASRSWALPAMSTSICSSWVRTVRTNQHVPIGGADRAQ